VDDISWRLSTSRPLGVECEEKSLVRVGVTLNDMKGRDERWRGKSSERAEHVKGRYWAIAKMFMISDERDCDCDSDSFYGRCGSGCDCTGWLVALVLVLDPIVSLDPKQNSRTMHTTKTYDTYTLPLRVS